MEAAFYNIERLAKLVSHVIPESDVSQVKDKWRLYMVKSEGTLRKANGCTRVDHYWSAVFEFITASDSVKYTKLQPESVESFFSCINAPIKIRNCC